VKHKSVKGTWHRNTSDAKFKENWDKIFKPKEKEDKEKDEGQDGRLP